MKAVFKKSNPIVLVFFFVMAVLWLALSAFLIGKNSDGGRSAMIVCFIIAVILCLLGIFLFIYNRGAYLQLDDRKIVGNFGLFNHLECKMADVRFAMAEMDRVLILINGRTYRIRGVKNAFEVRDFIRQRMPFEPCRSKRELAASVKKQSQYQKKHIFAVVCSGVLSFVWIFITIALTGARDLPEFHTLDWVFFSIMCALEVPTIIAMFVFAIKSGKRSFPLEKQTYELKRSILESTPLLSGPGRVISVLTDFDCSQRITVYGDCVDHEDDSTCYSIEVFDKNYKLIFAYQSECFASEDLPEITDGLWDVTDRIL